MRQLSRRLFLALGAACVSAALSVRRVAAKAIGVAPDMAYAHVRTYWERGGWDYLKAVKSSDADWSAIGQRLLDLCNDAPIGSMTFEMRDKQIEGHSKKCFVGTTLDVRSESPIRPYQRKIAVIAKNLLARGEKRDGYPHLCKASCIGCPAVDPAVCLKTALDTFNDVFEGGGTMAKLETRAAKGDWKL